MKSVSRKAILTLMSSTEAPTWSFSDQSRARPALHRPGPCDPACATSATASASRTRRVPHCRRTRRRRYISRARNGRRNHYTVHRHLTDPDRIRPNAEARRASSAPHPRADGHARESAKASGDCSHGQPASLHTISFEWLTARISSSRIRDRSDLPAQPGRARGLQRAKYDGDFSLSLEGGPAAQA